MGLTGAGALFLLGTFATGLGGWVICFSTTLLLLVGLAVPQLRSWCFRLHHRINDIVAGLWFNAVGFLIEVVHGVRFTTVVEQRTPSGEITTSCSRDDLRRLFRPPPPGKFVLVMMNHRTRLDWMLFWGLLARVPFRHSAHLKIVLADRLAAVPIFGWAMQQFRFLFLSRKWEKDERHIQAFAQHYRAMGQGCTLLIFPEGSDLSDTNLAKSQAYARANGLPVYQYILNPRTTGIDALRKAIGEENIHAIIDVTAGYTDGKTRPSDRNLLQGDMPKCLHLQFREYRFDTPREHSVWFPLTTATVFPEWVKERFQAKEQALAGFYGRSPVQFPGEGATAAPSARYAVVWVCWGVICYWVLGGIASWKGLAVLALFASVNALVTKFAGGVDHLLLFQ